MDEQSPQERKVIIDEDWKAQVQREKEEAARRERRARAERKARGEQELPPPSFAELVSLLEVQAAVAFGAIANPVSGKAEVNLAQAKHFIDLLGVVEEKTKGNLTGDEERFLQGVLYNLRMGYVEAVSRPAGGAGPGAAASPAATDEKRS